MIINPNAKTILCYGDSNTHGVTPEKDGRFPASVRWTGRLQQLLGDNSYVIEEGLGGRTTDLEREKPGRNGKTYLQPCLESHWPLDVILLMLGTNDLNLRYGRTAAEVAQALAGLAELTAQYASEAKLVLISPVHINEHAPKFAEFYADSHNTETAARSRELAAEIQKVAEAQKVGFFDAATVAKVGVDGLHIDWPSQKSLAEALAKVVEDLLHG